MDNAILSIELKVVGDDPAEDPKISAEHHFKMYADEPLSSTFTVSNSGGTKVVTLPADVRMLLIETDNPVKLTMNAVANTFTIKEILAMTPNKDLTALTIVNDGAEDAKVRVVAIQVEEQ